MNEILIKLVTDTSAILLTHDVMNLAFAGSDEYDSEACTIATRLIEMEVDKEDLPAVVKDEFRQWFTADLINHISDEQWTAVAEDIWAAQINTLAHHAAAMKAAS